MESNPFGLVYRKPADANKVGGRYLQNLCERYKQSQPQGQCDKSGEWLKAVTLADIMNAQASKSLSAEGWNPNLKGEEKKAAAEKQLRSMLENPLAAVSDPRKLSWEPTIPASGVIGSPIDGYAAGMKPKPIVFGVNSDEGTLFAAAFYDSMKKYFTPENLRGAIDLAFALQPGIPGKINGTSRYKPTAGDQKPVPPGYGNVTAEAAANIMTDAVFICGNVRAMDNVLGQPLGSLKPIYGYLLDQPPYIDLYSLHGEHSDHGACEPSTGNVCHANELPYVFNQLYEDNDQGYRPVEGRGDEQLGSEMSKAWFDFASVKDASDLPKSTRWIRYVKHGSEVRWIGGKDTPAPANLDDEAHCSSIWLRTWLYPHARTP